MRRVLRPPPLLAIACIWAVLAAFAVASAHVESPAAHDHLASDCAACHLVRSCSAVAGAEPASTGPAESLDAFEPSPHTGYTPLLRVCRAGCRAPPLA